MASENSGWIPFQNLRIPHLTNKIMGKNSTHIHSGIYVLETCKKKGIMSRI